MELDREGDIDSDPKQRGLWIIYDHIIDDGTIRITPRTGIRPPDQPDRLIVHVGPLCELIRQTAETVVKRFVAGHFPLFEFETSLNVVLTAIVQGFQGNVPNVTEEEVVVVPKIEAVVPNGGEYFLVKQAPGIQLVQTQNREQAERFIQYYMLHRQGDEPEVWLEKVVREEVEVAVASDIVVATEADVPNLIDDETERLEKWVVEAEDEVNSLRIRLEAHKTKHNSNTAANDLDQKLFG